MPQWDFGMKKKENSEKSLADDRFKTVSPLAPMKVRSHAMHSTNFIIRPPDRGKNWKLKSKEKKCSSTNNKRNKAQLF